MGGEGGASCRADASWGVLSLLQIWVSCGPAPSPPQANSLSQSQVLLFHSADGLRFEQQEAAIAQGFDSLGLVQDSDRVLVSGLDHRRQIPWYERYQSPAVDQLIWDGQSWSRERVAVAVDAPALIDPQWQGQALWYVAREGIGDPALGGVNRVMKGAELQLEGAGLADPSPVLFQGRELLFTTRWGDGVVLWEGSPWTQQAAWRQLTVPFARLEASGEVLAVYAVGVVQGRRLPVRMESVDGVNFTQPEALSLGPTPSSCTSPVLWSDAQGHWLLCVNEVTPAAPGR